jgi:hypothetical protein
MSSCDSHVIYSRKPVHSDTTLGRHQNSVPTILLDPNIKSRLRYQHSTGNLTWHFQNLSVRTFSSEENSVLCRKVRIMQCSLRRNDQGTAKGPLSLTVPRQDWKTSAITPLLKLKILIWQKRQVLNFLTSRTVGVMKNAYLSCFNEGTHTQAPQRNDRLQPENELLQQCSKALAIVASSDLNKSIIIPCGVTTCHAYYKKFLTLRRSNPLLHISDKPCTPNTYPLHQP